MKKLIYGISMLTAILIAVGFALPSTNRIEVSAEIDAHAATVFALVNDFRRVRHWSAWADKDPNARFLFSGPDRGVGATMTWDGTIIGDGVQTITASRPYNYVGITMSPGEADSANSWFSLASGDGKTRVTWGFETDYGVNIVARYFGSMLSDVVASDHREGMMRLKELAESLPAADFSELDVEHIAVAATEIAYLSTTSSPEPSAISAAMGRAFFKILKFIDEHHLDEDGAPISITRNFNGSTLAFDSAIPIRGLADTTPRDGATVKIGKTYGGPVIRVKHTGPYRHLAATHRKISAYLAALGIRRNGAAWESYVSDPGSVAEQNLLTYIYYPISAN